MLLVGLVVGFWAWIASVPSYQGRSATFWIDIFRNSTRNSPDAKKWEEANLALNAMGPKAIPVVIRMLKESESPFWNEYRRRFPRFPAWMAKVLPKPKPDLSSFDGVIALRAIGPSAEPMLVEMIENRNLAVRTAATGYFAFRTNEIKDCERVIPKLTTSLHDHDRVLRLWATYALGNAKSSAVSAIPDLIPLLDEPGNEPDMDMRRILPSAAAATLGKIGPQAKSALPSLRNLLTDKDAYTRAAAAVAIWRIEGDVTNTLPIMIQALPEIRTPSTLQVVEGLAEMGPRAKAAVPALKAELGSWLRVDNDQKIAVALKSIDPESSTNAEAK
jgi:hypothetical protein